MLIPNSLSAVHYRRAAGTAPISERKKWRSQYDPPTLQQRFVFPHAPRLAPRPASRSPVTVTPPAGAAVSGVLVRMGHFTVSLRDGSGQYRSWTRVPGLSVEKRDPYAAHVELLDRYTDKNIHDVVAYLATLK